MNIDQFLEMIKNLINITLNDEQKPAAIHGEGPHMLLATAGSGKTSTLTIKLAYLVLCLNIHPSRILTLTFSNASARDMERKFKERFGSIISSDLDFSTIHAFANSIVKKYNYKNGIKCKLIEGKDAPVNKTQIIKDIYRQVNDTVINDDKLEDLIGQMGYVINCMIDPKVFENTKAGVVKNFAEMFYLYQDYKEMNGYMDYDDMLVRAYHILKDNPDILDEYRSKYDYFLLDEAQDTSKIQYEIVKLLAFPKNNIFLCGDDDQVLYSWRGAFPQIILDFKKEFPNGVEYKMGQNYRSSKEIVEASSEFITNNVKRKEKSIYTKNPSYKPININRVKDEIEQINYIINTINDGSFLLKQNAILFRNNISLISIVDTLDKHGIPFYIKESKLEFFTHWVTKDILAFLKLAIDEIDIESFEQICFKMNGYISKQMVYYLQHGDTSIPIFDRLVDFPFKEDYQKETMVRIRWDFKQLQKKVPRQAIDFILDDLRYNDYLQEMCKTQGYSIENLNMILSTIKSISSGISGIQGLINRMEELQSKIIQSKSNKDNDAVRLMTLHGSKGLEWKRVFMVDLIDGQFPAASSIELDKQGDASELEEERRLFYVGMTRAELMLEVMVISKKNGDRVEQSRFVSELTYILNRKNKTIDSMFASILQNKKKIEQTNLNAEIDKLKTGDKQVEKVETIKKEKVGTKQVEEKKEQGLNPDSLKPGVPVIHVRLGVGRVVSVKDNNINIVFEPNKDMTLSLRSCLERNLLKLA